MEIYERIWTLRKKHLKLSQAAFGEKLGVNRDVINNIENNRLSRPEQKLSLYKLICSEFNVNEEWLLNGTEPMFTQPETFNLNDFIKANGATQLELEILKAYFELDFETRQKTINHFKERLSGTANLTDSMISDSIVSNSSENVEESYKKSCSYFAQSTDSPASNTIVEESANKAANQ